MSEANKHQDFQQVVLTKTLELLKAVGDEMLFKLDKARAGQDSLQVIIDYVQSVQNRAGEIIDRPVSVSNCKPNTTMSQSQAQTAMSQSQAQTAMSQSQARKTEDKPEAETKMTKSDLHDKAVAGEKVTDKVVKELTKAEAPEGGNPPAGGVAATAQSLHDKQEHLEEVKNEVLSKPEEELTKEDASKLMSAESRAMGGIRPSKGSASAHVQSAADHNAQVKKTQEQDDGTRADHNTQVKEAQEQAKGEGKGEQDKAEGKGEQEKAEGKGEQNEGEGEGEQAKGEGQGDQD